VAKKTRAPAPPRKVQAPKKRVERREPASRRTRLWIAAAIAALLVAGAIGGIAYAVAGGDDEAPGTAGGGGGACAREEFEAQGQDHLPDGEGPPEGFEYNSFPATSGPHDNTPAIFDVYSEPVPQRHLIHNLEHGAVVVQYGQDVPRSEIDQIVAWWNQDPTGIVVSPLPDTPRARELADKITLAAWTARKTAISNDTQELDPADEEEQRGRLATCTRFDEEAFSDFVDDYRFRGPEAFLPEQLEPGN
jgi:Protein of unknown function (DUF3105)